MNDTQCAVASIYIVDNDAKSEDIHDVRKDFRFLAFE